MTGLLGTGPVGPSVEELRSREHARAIWIRADPWLAGTPAQLYLERRGIWEAVDLNDTRLRFARHQHPQTREAKVPCLIVARSDVQTGAVTGIQRVFLTPDGQKYRTRYLAPDGSTPLADAKISLGVNAGAWAMLCDQERRTWKAVGLDEIEHAETTDKLVLAEGFETALSASLLFDDRPAWAKCSGFPAEMWLPNGVRDVLICADHDPPLNRNGRPRVTSEDRARTLAAFIHGTGRRCEVVVAGEVGQDANDVLIQVREVA